MNLLFITIPTPAVYSGLPFSPLRYHVYSFIAPLVFCFIIVSCIVAIMMLFSFINVSISSLFPICFIPLTFIVATHHAFPSNMFVIVGSWALAFLFVCLLCSALSFPFLFCCIAILLFAVLWIFLLLLLIASVN